VKLFQTVYTTADRQCTHWRLDVDQTHVLHDGFPPRHPRQSVSSCNSASTSPVCACYTPLTFDILHPPTHTLSRRLRLTAFCTQGPSSPFITFRVSRRRREMYTGHARLCVCLSAAACPHYRTDPDVTWGMVGGAI